MLLLSRASGACRTAVARGAPVICTAILLVACALLFFAAGVTGEATPTGDSVHTQPADRPSDQVLSNTRNPVVGSSETPPPGNSPRLSQSPSPVSTLTLGSSHTATGNRSREQAVLARIQALIPVVEELRNESFETRPSIQFLSSRQFNQTVQRTSPYQQTISQSTRELLFWDILLAPPSFTDALLPSENSPLSNGREPRPPSLPGTTPPSPQSVPSHLIQHATRPADGVRYISSQHLLALDRTQTSLTPLTDLSLVRELARALQHRQQSETASVPQPTAETLTEQYSSQLVTDGVGALVSLAYAVECGGELSEFLPSSTPTSATTVLTSALTRLTSHLDSPVPSPSSDNASTQTGTLPGQNNGSQTGHYLPTGSSFHSLLSAPRDLVSRPTTGTRQPTNLSESPTLNPLAVHSQAGATGLWAVAAHVASDGWTQSSLFSNSSLPHPTELLETVPPGTPAVLDPHGQRNDSVLPFRQSFETDARLNSSSPQVFADDLASPAFTDSSTNNWSRLRPAVSAPSPAGPQLVGPGELVAGLWTGSLSTFFYNRSSAPLASSAQARSVPAHTLRPIRGLNTGAVYTFGSDTESPSTPSPDQQADSAGAVFVTNWTTSSDAATFARTYLDILTEQQTTQRDRVTYTVSDESPHTGTYRIIQYQTRVTIVFADTLADVATLRPQFYFGHSIPVAPQEIPEQSALLNESTVFQQTPSPSGSSSQSSSPTVGTAVLLGLVTLLLVGAVSLTWVLIRHK